MVLLNKVSHHYDRHNIVNLPDLKLVKGEQLVVYGLSGCGKSTLMNIIAGLLKPSSGTVRIDGTEIYHLNENKRDQFRGRCIGMVFQQMHLINTLTVLDNIRLAKYMAGLKQDDNKINRVLNQLEIADKRKSYADELSQGQKQRVSIARAVINGPGLILADEPTSSLDDKRSMDVIKLLKSQADEYGATLIITTHDQRVKDKFEKTVEIKLNKEYTL